MLLHLLKCLLFAVVFTFLFIQYFFSDCCVLFSKHRRLNKNLHKIEETVIGQSVGGQVCVTRKCTKIQPLLGVESGVDTGRTSQRR